MVLFQLHLPKGFNFFEVGYVAHMGDKYATLVREQAQQLIIGHFQEEAVC